MPFDSTQTPRDCPSKAEPPARQGGAGYPQPAGSSRPNLFAAKPDSRGAVAVSLADAAPRPFTPARPAEATGPRPTIRLGGSCADYDRLTQALADYQTTLDRADYVALRNAADACGRPDGEPPMSWAAFEINKLKGMNL